MPLRIIPIIFLCFCILSNAKAQSNNPSYSITLLDAENGLPIAGVMLLDSLNQYAGRSDIDGVVHTKVRYVRTLHPGYVKQWCDMQNTQQLLLQPKTYGLNQVVIKADQQQSTGWESGATVNVAQGKDLERDQDLHIAPVLNRMPGVFMQSSNLSTNRLSIRGIGARTPYGTSKIRAYWEDIPLTSGDVSTELADIDLSTISRIEVLKGPASSIYGAGLGGTVILHAKRPQHALAITQENTLGSFGLFRNATTAAFAQKGVSLMVNYNHSTWDGYRDNSEYQRDNFTAALTHYNQHRGSLHILVSHIGVNAQIPSSIGETLYRRAPTSAAANWAGIEGYEAYSKNMMGLSYKQPIGKNWLWQTSSFISTFQNDEPRPFNILRENQWRTGARTRLVHVHTQNNRATWQWQMGGEVFHEVYNWQTYEQNQGTRGTVLQDLGETRQYFNIFSQWHWYATNKWQVELGVNLNQTAFAIQQYMPISSSWEKQTYPLTFSPRAALHFTANQFMVFYANVGHGFSPPTVAETLGPEGNVQENLKPEKAWSAELGWRVRLLGNKLHGEITAYQMWVRDLLVSQRTAEDAFIAVNAGQTLHRGIESQLSYLLYHNSQTQVEGFANYTLNAHQFQDFVLAGEQFSGNALTGVPPHVANAGVDFKIRQFYGNVLYQFVDAMPMRDDNSLYSDAYGLWHAKGGYTLQLKNSVALHLEAGIRNMLNAKYASQILVNASSFGNNEPRYYYPGLPRNYFLSLKLEWH